MATRSIPSGTSIDDLRAMLNPEPAPAMSAQPAAPIAPEQRPHAEFTAAVERRRATDRRGHARVTRERRAFRSPNLAAPIDGPSDPRPQHAPVHTAPPLPQPIDTRITQDILPAIPIELANREVAGQTIRSTQGAASHAATALHHQSVVQQPAPHQYASQLAQYPRQRAAAAQPSTPAQVQMQPAAAPVQAQSPVAGGIQFPTEIAAVVADPHAWYAGATAAEPDAAMQIWNAPQPQQSMPAPQLPLAQIPAAQMPVAQLPVTQMPAAQMSGAQPAAATPIEPSVVIPQPYSPLRAQDAALLDRIEQSMSAAAGPAVRTGLRGRLRLGLGLRRRAAGAARPTLLRTGLVITIPAVLGIGLAVGLDRFLL
jgi:nicotinate-nucleotide--dimethylbenzimidazole phosphoribosyltransferase